ncbi:type A lantibiotic [Staphylococcus capitis]|uniref:Epicidin 280 n=1 Tax=Staphylococcus epidermidis TaxID=1282 RepID=O54220_STAEP|nr:type A lantibiotic [Staphylococcus capitis]MDS4025296.1 type A lantibiotic [Staphylococcus capitis]CAA74348.1 epicidin 280 [Staphylococcus epidermidis]
MENKKDLFDLEIKKDNMENNNELEAQSLGPAIKATRQVCPKATRFVTVSCKKSDCQ